MSERDISEIMRLLGTAIKGINELKTNFTEVKAEIADVKSELKAEIADVKSELKAEIADLKTELKAEIADVKTELKAEIADVKSELKAEIADVKSELKAEIADVKSELKTDLHNFRSEVNLRFDRVEDKLEKLETQNKIVTLDFMEVRVNHSRLEKRVEILEPKAA